MCSSTTLWRIGQHQPIDYSVRKARMGSTEAALLAGINPARAATKTTMVMATA